MKDECECNCCCKGYDWKNQEYEPTETDRKNIDNYNIWRRLLKQIDDEFRSIPDSAKISRNTTFRTCIENEET